MIAPLEEVRSYEAVKLDVIFDFMWKIINFEFKSAFISRVVEGSWPPTAYLSRQHSFVYPPCICRIKFVYFVANPYLLWQFHISVREAVIYVLADFAR